MLGDITVADEIYIVCGHAWDKIYSRSLFQSIRFPEGKNYEDIFGNIQHINSYHYDQVRNRKCSDGSYWLSDDVMKFMNERLSDDNKEIYSLSDKIGFFRLKYFTIMKNIFSKMIKNR